MPTNPLPFVQSIPHAGLDRPPELDGRLLLDDVAVYNECDLWADKLFDFAHPDLEADGGRGTLAVVTTGIARAIVDVNREPDDLDNPDGVVKAQTSYGVANYAAPLAALEKQALVERYWSDYHSQLRVALRAHSGAARLLLDCHTMAQIGPNTYQYAGKPRPLVCLANLGGRDGETKNSGASISLPPQTLRRAGAIATELFADMSLLEPAGSTPPVVALNYPFAGGYIVRRYAVEPGASWNDEAPAIYGLMVEINRGLYVGNQSATTPVQTPNEDRIAAIRFRLYRWANELAALL